MGGATIGCRANVNEEQGRGGKLWTRPRLRRSGDTDLGQFDDAEILATVGVVPDDIRDH